MNLHRWPTKCSPLSSEDGVVCPLKEESNVVARYDSKLSFLPIRNPEQLSGVSQLIDTGNIRAARIHLFSFELARLRGSFNYQDEITMHWAIKSEVRPWCSMIVMPKLAGFSRANRNSTTARQVSLIPLY